jgi:acyl carrier protein
VSDEEIKALVIRELKRIAPEVETDHLDPAIDLREQVDLDSMDILNLAIAIHTVTGVDIPEADYPQMTTLNGSVAYLRSRIPSKVGGASH